MKKSKSIWGMKSGRQSRKKKTGLWGKKVKHLLKR